MRCFRVWKIGVILGIVKRIKLFFCVEIYGCLWYGLVVFCISYLDCIIRSLVWVWVDIGEVKLNGIRL